MSRLIGVLEGAVCAARRGDKTAARCAARYIAEDLAAGRPLAPLAMQYLLDGLQDIAAGEPGNHAFHTSGKKGRPTAKNVARDLTLAAYVGALHQDGHSIGDAVQAVVLYLDEAMLNESAVEKIYRKRQAWCQPGFDLPPAILDELRAFLPPKRRT